jgi:hypothetical protein
MVFIVSVVMAWINESQEQKQYIDEACWMDVDFLEKRKPFGWEYLVFKMLAEQAAL